jgi:hypothetical protein
MIVCLAHLFRTHTLLVCLCFKTTCAPLISGQRLQPRIRPVSEQLF